MSIKKVLIGSTASLLLASGFVATASADEYGEVIEESVTEEKGNGISLPNNMKVGDTYEEVVSENGREDITYTITKTDEELDNDIMLFNAQTVPVSGRASFNVSGRRGTSNLSFDLETRDGLIDSVTRPQHNLIYSVDSADLTIESTTLASYHLNLSVAIPWIGGPSFTAGLRATIDTSGANQNINTLYTEIY